MVMHNFYDETQHYGWYILKQMRLRKVQIRVFDRHGVGETKTQPNMNGTIVKTRFLVSLLELIRKGIDSAIYSISFFENQMEITRNMILAIANGHKETTNKNKTILSPQ